MLRGWLVKAKLYTFFKGKQKFKRIATETQKQYIWNTKLKKLRKQQWVMTMIVINSFLIKYFGKRIVKNEKINKQRYRKISIQISSFDDKTEVNTKLSKQNWYQIPCHPSRILVSGVGFRKRMLY